MNFDVGMVAGNVGDDTGEIPLKMQTEREEVGDYKDSLGALGGEARNSRGQIRGAPLEEGGFHHIESALARHTGSYSAHGVIGGRDTRPVREDGDSETQALWCT